MDIKPVTFPTHDGTRVPLDVYRSQEVYELELQRIYRGPTWSFVALEAEIPQPGDFKSTFVGDTPVVVTRTKEGKLSVWVNRCAHRGAAVCRKARGNATSHTCVYHQWNYTCEGALQGVPFRRGQKDMVGMPADFDPSGRRGRRLEPMGGRAHAPGVLAERAEPRDCGGQRGSGSCGLLRPAALVLVRSVHGQHPDLWCAQVASPRRHSPAFRHGGVAVLLSRTGPAEGRCRSERATRACDGAPSYREADGGRGHRAGRPHPTDSTGVIADLQTFWRGAIF